jgi:hypothetical protein
MILSPFIDLDRLAEIFGSDMLNNESLIPIFDKLVGMVPEKPFECVGTCDEVNMAINMVINRMGEGQKELPKLYGYYKSLPLYQRYLRIENPYLTYYNEENSVPSQFVDRIKNLMLK